MIATGLNVYNEVMQRYVRLLFPISPPVVVQQDEPLTVFSYTSMEVAVQQSAYMYMGSLSQWRGRRPYTWREEGYSMVVWGLQLSQWRGRRPYTWGGGGGDLQHGSHNGGRGIQPSQWRGRPYSNLHAITLLDM